jgi:hypothetical protein
MVINFTNISKTNNHLFYYLTEYIKTTIYDVGNTGPGRGQTHKCGGLNRLMRHNSWLKRTFIIYIQFSEHDVVSGTVFIRYIQSGKVGKPNKLKLLTWTVQNHEQYNSMNSTIAWTVQWHVEYNNMNSTIYMNSTIPWTVQ